MVKILGQRELNKMTKLVGELRLKADNLDIEAAKRDLDERFERGHDKGMGAGFRLAARWVEELVEEWG